jgi:hypothetical protein
MGLILFLLWVLYIPIDALVNWWLITIKNVRPDHVLFVIGRGIFASAIGSACFLTGFIQWFHWAVFTISSFWVLFDILLNKFRRLDWDYIGVKDGKDAISDSFGLKYPKLFWTSKVIAFILALYLALRYIYVL